MKRSIGVGWGKLWVGLLIMFAIAAAFYASLSGGGTSIFESKGKFTCYFRNVNGLVTGSPVWMSGVEVGNVRSVTFVNLDSIRQVQVVCRVKKGVWSKMTTNAAVQLGTIGFLGDKYIEVIPGTLDQPQIEEMAVVPTRDVGEVTAMFKEGEKALTSAGSMVNNLDSLLTRMNRGEGTLGKIARDDAMYVRLTELLDRLTALTAGLQKNQDRLFSSVEQTARSIDTLTTTINQKNTTVGRLLNDPALYDNLAATSAKLDSIMAHVNQGDGSLGLMVRDTALYVEVTNLVVRINSLVADIEKNPRKYFKFSVF